MNTELIARIEAAEVGGRDFDGEVAAATVGWLEHDGSPITTSLDAVLALAKRVLPSETMWNISHLAVIGGKDFYFCDLYLPETGPEIDTSGDGWSPSLAVCAAILRALDAREQK